MCAKWKGKQDKLQDLRDMHEGTDCKCAVTCKRGSDC